MSEPEAIGENGGSILIPPPAHAAGPVPLRWYTAAELAAKGSTEPDWLVRPLIALGSITELSARVKLGKTRLMLDAIAAMLGEVIFLGQPTRKVGVVYLTEEGEATFRQALKRAGLLERVDLHVLLRHDARSLAWPEIVSRAVQKCRDTGSALIVIDTLPDWAGLRGDDENNSGKALEAMQPLQDAAAAHLAIVVLRHDRKGGGAVGDSSRGSSAFSGAADILLSLKPADGKKATTRRRLEGVGRFDGIPAVLTLDLKDGHYVVIGEGRDAVLHAAADRIRKLLEPAGTMLVVDQVFDQMGGDVSKATLKRALAALDEAGAIEKVPKQGKTKKAIGYRLK